MPNAQELYTAAVCHLPPSERLRLASLILNGLTQDSAPPRCYALDLLEELPGRQLFKTSAEADEYLQRERDSWEH